MAPTKELAKLPDGRPREPGSIFETFKSKIQEAKGRFNVLSIHGKTKVEKPKTTSKAHSNTQERLQAFVEERASGEDDDLGQTRDPTASKQASDEGVTARHDNSPNTSPVAQPPREDLSVNQFEIGKPLGRGRFGQVYLARHRTTNYICALKVISKEQCVSSEEEQLIRRELEVHQIMRHAHILRLYSWFHNQTNIYLILEYAPNGDLYSKLKEQPRGRFKEHEAARYITQLAEALRYIHRKKAIHRDIKPENILLGYRNEIKLADFGWSVYSESGFRSTVCGTVDYLSPEVAVMWLKPGQTEQWYTNAIDLWSLGVLTYEMLVGKPPFEMSSLQRTLKKIAHFKGKIKVPRHVSKAAETFITQLLNLEAEKRMSLDEVLEHPWIRENVDQAEGGIRRFSRLLEKANR